LSREHRKRGSESEARDPDFVNAASRAELVDGKSDVIAPRAHKPRGVFIIRRIARAPKVVTKDRKSRTSQALGKMALGPLS
jgi:hypothetical protein